MRSSRRFLERGQGLVEYALILVLVAVVVIVILGVAGKQIGNIFCDVAIRLGSKASDSITMCAAPRASILITGTGLTRTIEADVHDNKGNTEPNITSVEFLDNGVSKHTEYKYHYCMGGGDDSCNSYTFSGSGTHTIKVIMTDADGNIGEASVTIDIS